MTKTLQNEVSSHDHSLGADDADITVVLYGDFECPYTRMEYRVTKQFLGRYPERLRFVFRHFPLTKKHPHALAAAEAAEAAAEQNAFWRFADYLFEHQKMLTRKDLEQHAEAAGLDLGAYRKVLESQAPHERVEASLREALEQGLMSIPSIFLNGDFIGHKVRKPLNELLTGNEA